MFLENWQIAILVIVPVLITLLFVYLVYCLYFIIKDKRRQKKILLHRVDNLEDRLCSCEYAFSNNIHEIVEQIVKLNKEVFKNGKTKK